MKKILIVFGTRPEAIKMCPLIKELQRRPFFQVCLCVTAQHRQMLDQVLEAFQVFPDYDLNIMTEKQNLFDITTHVMNKIKEVVEKERPDVVLVHGDTSTAFASALACFYLNVPIGHVEAGLRTYDLRAPFPEEFNRQVVSIAAKYHFAPTESAAQNLLKEGRNSADVFITGNTVIDAMKNTVSESYTHPVLDWVGDAKMIFITAHRRENLGQPMRNMFRAIRRVLETHEDCRAVYPVHMNPAIRQIAAEEFGDCASIRLIDPIDVVDCHNFEARSYLCLTDSGGIQEECPYFGVPVLVLRNTTERPEGVATGSLKLVGTDEETIYNAFRALLEDPAQYKKMSTASNPYGDGFASSRIADILEYGGCQQMETERKKAMSTRASNSVAVSVIVPVFNTERYLRTCLNSLASQTFSDFEAILVDDGSTDASFAICKEFCEKDDRFRVLQKKNGGASSARNLGLEHARGEYVYFLDSDDEISDSTLHKLHTCAKESAADLVFFEALARNNGGDFFTGQYDYHKQYLPDAPYRLMEEMLAYKEFHVSIPLLFIKKSLFDVNGLRFREGIISEDMIMAYRLFSLAERGAHIHEYLYCRRFHSGSVTTSKKTEKNYISAAAVYRDVSAFRKTLPEERQAPGHVIRCAYLVLNVYRQMPPEIREQYKSDFEEITSDILQNNAYGDRALKLDCKSKFLWGAYKLKEKILRF